MSSALFLIDRSRRKITKEPTTQPTTNHQPNHHPNCRHGAVHAAFAGLTAATVGLVGGHIALLPARAVIAAPRTVKVDGQLWNRLRSSIAQPPLDRPPPPRTPNM